MRVAMVSYEFPPLVVSGVASHADGLARALARAGHEVVVFTRNHPRIDDDSVTVDGVRVLRASSDLPWIPDRERFTQTVSTNHQIAALAGRLGPSWRPDVVHAHDWMTAWAADTLKAWWDVPLVATIHATERGRHGGHVPIGIPAQINSVEWWLTYQAQQVICCSAFMRREIVDGFELPFDKLHLIPNGIDPAVWQTPDPAPEREPLVVAWGRVQYEKGFQVLAAAMSRLRGRVPDVRCVIVGRGSYLPELQMQFDIEGVNDLVSTTGFISDDDLHALLHRAGCAVIPSLYEPFGIVALEAMAAGAPTVAARTGGLAEILDNTRAGVLFEPGNADALADAIAEVLLHPEYTAEMQAGAHRLLQARYSWDAIAAQTVGVYRHV
jgi:glycogen synthase